MPTLYDELPYHGSAFVETHPDRLAVIGTLFGMTPAPVDRCRVLELACGDGGNLVPMAFTLPESHFTGIDLAETAIARGQELIDQLRLSNIRLQQLDLMDFNSSFGEFDYIIAHGLYSWVPAPVRERILDVCKTHLAPNGIAYISYNTYPGGHLRDAIRRMMQYHVRDSADPPEKSRRARELLEFLVESHPEQDAYSLFLQFELQSFLERSPAHFFHDELSDCNNRFYFHEFSKDASRHRLQFLGEARLLSSQTGDIPPTTLEKLQTFCGDDYLAREQYIDFVKLRNFRHSLICHSEVVLDRRLGSSPVTKMLVASAARPASADPNVSSAAAEEFRFHEGAGSMSTNHPLGKAAMLHLGRIWPSATSFSDLLHAARGLAGRDSGSGFEPLETDASWLSGTILKLQAANFAELHTHAPPCATKVSETPVASALVRAQLRTRQRVTNLRHASISLDDEAARLMVSLLDGTRDHAQLLSELSDRCEGVTPDRLESNLAELVRISLLSA